MLRGGGGPPRFDNRGESVQQRAWLGRPSAGRLDRHLTSRAGRHPLTRGRRDRARDRGARGRGRAATQRVRIRGACPVRSDSIERVDPRWPVFDQTHVLRPSRIIIVEFTCAHIAAISGSLLGKSPRLGYDGSCDTTDYPRTTTMKKFESRFGSLVTAVLSGFDRLVFRGTLQALMGDFAMFAFLNRASPESGSYGIALRKRVGPRPRFAITLHDHASRSRLTVTITLHDHDHDHDHDHALLLQSSPQARDQTSEQCNERCCQLFLVPDAAD